MARGWGKKYIREKEKQRRVWGMEKRKTEKMREMEMLRMGKRTNMELWEKQCNY
jgi:hypothetical protein